MHSIEEGDLVLIARMLCDPTRTSILRTLHSEGEMSVTDLTNKLGKNQSGISHQLRTLSDNGMIHGRKAGRFTMYSMKNEAVQALLETLT